MKQPTSTTDSAHRVTVDSALLNGSAIPAATGDVAPSAGRRRSPEQVAVGMGVVRTAIGLGMVLRPTWLSRTLGVDKATARTTDWSPRMTGLRELALGGGMLLAMRQGADTKPWLLAQLLADSGDAVAFASGVRRGSIPVVMGVGSVAAALVGVASGIVALRPAQHDHSL